MATKSLASLCLVYIGESAHRYPEEDIGGMSTITTTITIVLLLLPP